MAIIEALKPIAEIINKFIPDGAEKNRLNAEIEKASLEVDKQRLGALSNMLGSNSFFVAGAIPSILWVVVISIFNNYILMPWAVMFGGKIPDVSLPGEVWTLAGWIISGLLAKKAIDGNAFYSKDGALLKPSRSEPALNVLEMHNAPVTVTPSVVNNNFIPPEITTPKIKVVEDHKITIEPDHNISKTENYDERYDALLKKYNIS